MIRFDKAVILVGQGEVNEAVLTDVARHYPIVALDGGVRKLNALGLQADIIIGDMDSCPPDIKAEWAQNKMIVIEEQDSNDFEKALYSIEAPLFFGFGLLGGRFDQLMASIHALVKYQAHKKLIMVSPYEVLWCVKGDITISLPADCACAILPIEPLTFAASSGLRWPIEGMCLEIGSLISSSNQMISHQLTLSPCADDLDKAYLISCDVKGLDDVMRYYLSL